MSETSNGPCGGRGLSVRQNINPTRNNTVVVSTHQMSYVTLIVIITVLFTELTSLSLSSLSLEIYLKQITKKERERENRRKKENCQYTVIFSTIFRLILLLMSF
jgi:1,4-dihydroxy-2-naphthoate octaprenyltransferase